MRVKAWTLQEDAREIFEARLLIEPHLAGHAALPLQLHIGATGIDRLKTLADAMMAITQCPSTPESYRAWFGANSEFHDIITVAANNTRLDRSLRSMKETPLIKWTFDTYGDADRECSARQHVEIVAAFRGALEQRNSAWAEAITCAATLYRRRKSRVRPLRPGARVRLNRIRKLCLRTRSTGSRCTQVVAKAACKHATVGDATC